MIVLGLHGGVTLGQHEPAAALIVNGRPVAVCEEERYLRIKSCYGYLPVKSIEACLSIAGVSMEDVDLIVTPGSSYDDFAQRWRHHITHLYGSCPKIECVHHQRAHLAAAFYGAGYEESLVLSLDASGDGLSGMVAIASRDNGIAEFISIPTDNSLGYFYTAMTYYLGFGDGDEYKVMGLAPYGRNEIDLSSIIEPATDGWRFRWETIRSDPSPRSPFEPSYSTTLNSILEIAPRKQSDPISQIHKDLARCTQVMLEECILSLLRAAKAQRPELKSLCYAGGIALNCSANQRILREAGFQNLYVSPVSSDRGLALGCAYLGAVTLGDRPWQLWNAYQGSSYSDSQIAAELVGNGLQYSEIEDPSQCAAELINRGKVIGWFQGRSEAGARSLGNRSILASAATVEMRDLVNRRIKYREEFRPFAPSVTQENAADLFDTFGVSDLPFMTITLPVLEHQRHRLQAITHVDGTARVQTVRSSDNELYYELIRNYGKLSGTPAILNTTFNLKGQPIVETPRDAIMTFYGCGLDALIVGNFLLEKRD